MAIDVDSDAMDRVRAIDTEVTHIWMVRTFLSHADKSADDEDLRDVVGNLYDFILAVGPMDDVDDLATHLKMRRKHSRNFEKRRNSTERFSQRSAVTRTL